MNEPADGNVRVTRGDAGVDRSQTDIDNSRRTDVQADDHSVRNLYRTASTTTSVTESTSLDDHSSRTHDDHSVRRRSHTTLNLHGSSSIAIVALALMAVVIVAVLLVLRPIFNARVVPETQVPSSGGTSELPRPQPQLNPPPNPAAPPPNAATKPPAVRPAIAPASQPSPPAEPVALDPDRFVNRGLVRPGARAVLIVDQRNGADSVLTGRLAADLGAQDALFKPSFVQEGLFSRAQQGDAEVLRELGLDALESIALGVRSVAASPQDVAGVGMMRANVTIALRVFQPSQGFTTRLVTASDIGAGFDELQAVASGTEKALAKVVRELGR